jgi:hypothetical protein
MPKGFTQEDLLRLLKWKQDLKEGIFTPKPLLQAQMKLTH